MQEDERNEPGKRAAAVMEEEVKAAARAADAATPVPKAESPAARAKAASPDT